MRKTQADTPLGSLLIRNRLPENFQGESKERITIFPRGYSIFDYYTYMVTAFVVNGKSINRDLYFKIYFECSEKLRRNPGAKEGKGKCFYFLSKYPWDFIFSNPELSKQLIRNINLKIDEILINKRAQGSCKWKAMKEIHGVIELIPGPSKENFPEPRYIGVGYRDKGSSRVKSYDGSPSWQDVATFLGEDTAEKSKQKRDVHVDRLRSDHNVFVARQHRRLRKARRESFSWL